MVRRSPKDAGQPVNFYNGKFAGRYYCVTPRCPSSISAHDHNEGLTLCFKCTSTGVDWVKGRVEVDDD